MKNIIVGLILLMGSSAFATKARVQALGYAAHLTDEQYIFADVLYANYLNTFVSLESGLTVSDNTTTSTTNAEGMISYVLNDKSTLVVSLGHQDDMVLAGRALINTIGSTYMMSQNPVHVFYGLKGESVNYGFGLLYSDFKDKVADATESSSGVGLGAEVGAWQFYGNFLFANKVKTAAANEFDGNGGISLNTYYTGENFHAYLTVNQFSAKSTTAGTENESHAVRTIYLGLLQTNAKDGNDLFYGAQLVSVNADCKTLASATCDQKFTSLTMPVWIGVEAEAAPWLVLRGSVTQSVLINQSKDDVGYPVGAFAAATGGVSEFGAGPNSTVVAAGAGLKFNKVIVDGTLQGNTNQNLNATNLFAQLGLKYTY